MDPEPAPDLPEMSPFPKMAIILIPERQANRKLKSRQLLKVREPPDNS